MFQSQNNSPVRFAVLGYGRIGKRHAETIADNPEAHLVAACDVLPISRLENLPPDILFFHALDDLLRADCEVDVVNICTPNGLHAEQAIQILEARKHVVIEKPMALTKLDCERVIHKALNVSRQVFCVMQNRYSPPAVWLKQLVDTQKLGNIYLVEINCYWNRDHRYYFPDGQKHAWKGTKQLDGGVFIHPNLLIFIDIFILDFLEILFFISGKFLKFNSKIETELEDNGILQFELLRGGLGSFTYSTACWHNNFESTLTVIGEKGTIKIGGQYMERVEYCQVEHYEMPVLQPTNPSNEYRGYVGSAANHQYVIQNVIDVLRGRETPTTNALEGMKVVDIIERMYQAGIA
ncbi:MAG: Gfo/Idh/MocA family oxidoreductase [Saprospiraceae bacterium]|nr:Gfo/Idh/MocA family oxidoreductase [Saprospiraceae bacterium]